MTVDSRRGLTVGVAQTVLLTEARQFLIDLLEWLSVMGRPARAALLRDEGPVRGLLEPIAHVRVTKDLRPRSPLGLAESLMRRVDGRVAGRIRDLRLHRRRAWLDGAEVVHLNSPQAVTLLRWLPTPPEVVTTYVHPDDLGVADLADPDRDLLLRSTDRFVAATNDVAADLVERLAVPVERVVVRSRPIVGPRPDPAPGDLAAARRALGLPPTAPIVAIPPVPDWMLAPDLTIALAWELRRRRPHAPPHVVWFGAPTDRHRRWPIEHDLAAIGLDTVHLVDRITRGPVTDPVALADVVVLPSRPSPPGSGVNVDAAAMLGTPTLCWDNHPDAEAVAEWTGDVVPFPDVETMADRLLHLFDDPIDRERLAAAGRARFAADTDAFLAVLGLARVGVRHGAPHD